MSRIVGFFIPLETRMIPSGVKKRICHENFFRGSRDSSQFQIRGLCVYGLLPEFLTIGTYILSLVMSKGSSNRLDVLRGSWTIWPSTQKRTSYARLCGFVRWPLALVGSIVNSGEFFPLNCMLILYIQTYIHYNVLK